MAIVSRNSNTNKWKDREISPERTKVWTEPNSKGKTERKRVPVVYYLCRDGQLEHPHFMEVPISSNEGLHLKDVINRLNSLRGKGMASLYSWSSKRSYKNGFVWHDLSENDFIYPAHGQEYVLKGSEIHDSSASFSSQETVTSGEKLPGNHRSGEERDFPVVVRRRNQSWSALDLHEYKVYKSESSGEYAGKAADASTQTDDKRRRQRKISIREEEDDSDKISELTQQNFSELNREEISPPPSSSSPETLETLIQADGSVIGISGSDIQTADMHPSGRMKASTVLMQLISCGSFSVKDYESAQSTTNKDHQGFSLMSHYRSRLPRGPPNHQQVPKEQESPMENPSFGRIQLEDKEYFSGSLIETKKNDFAALKRSSSYNADRSSKMELKDREIDGVRAKCMPRRPKIPTRNAGTITIDASKISIEGSK